MTDDALPSSAQPVGPTSLKAVIEHLNKAPADAAHTGPSLTSKAKRARTVARLALVQALYQMEITGGGVESVIREFTDHRFDGDLDGEPLAEADEAFFAEGVRAVVSHQAVIDSMVSDRLAVNWRLERLDSTLRAILRSGAWELKYRPDVASAVVINEYVEIARAFFGETEARFVNAALDGVAKDTR